MLNKQRALLRAGGSGCLNTRWAQFSNINAAKDVWWVDVPLARMGDDGPDSVDLLLFDDRADELHHLVVPTKYLSDHIGQLTVRADKKCVRLELNARDPHRFRNVKPVSSEVDFSQFVTRTI